MQTQASITDLDRQPPPTNGRAKLTARCTAQAQAMKSNKKQQQLGPKAGFMKPHIPNRSIPEPTNCNTTQPKHMSEYGEQYAKHCV